MGSAWTRRSTGFMSLLNVVAAPWETCNSQLAIMLTKNGKDWMYIFWVAIILRNLTTLIYTHNHCWHTRGLVWKVVLVYAPTIIQLNMGQINGGRGATDMGIIYFLILDQANHCQEPPVPPYSTHTQTHTHTLTFLGICQKIQIAKRIRKAKHRPRYKT